jgi:ppGpp synthetase/RelA/SpoT-type nucleotidyltranferase
MTPEALQKRLVELQNMAKQAEAQLMQISGAIQDTQYWIAEVSKEKSDAADPVNDAQGV